MPHGDLPFSCVGRGVAGCAVRTRVGPGPHRALVSTAVVAIHPIELDDVISNPGMGLQTFYNTKATDPNNGTLPLGSAYTRYYWSEFEPSQGNFSFTEMVNDYNAAQARSRTIALASARTMTGRVAPNGCEIWASPVTRTAKRAVRLCGLPIWTIRRSRPSSKN